MPDYKKMYLTMLRATEDAINILIAAQQACEELYLRDTEAAPQIFPLPCKQKNDDA